MTTSKHSRAKFIWLHQAAVLISAVTAIKISEEGDYILVPLFVGLSPLLLAIYFSLKEAGHVDTRKLNTTLISSLVGGVFSLTIVAFWAMLATAIMLSGFH